jgi:hypothetical protein
MNNYVELLTGKEPIAMYDNEFKGKRYFHIRKMYQDQTGELQPGKGLAVPLDKKQELLKAIMEVMK